jgi:hypothetical protein
MSQKINAVMEIAYFDTRDARGDIPAQVMFDDKGLTLVAPGANDESVLWHGERRGQGHYVMSSSVPGMEASLHRFADSTILEGFWRNGRERGFWRLHMPEDAVIPREGRVVKLPTAARKRKAPAVRKKARRAA